MIPYDPAVIGKMFSDAAPECTGDREDIGTEDGTMLRFTEVHEGVQINMIQLFANLMTVNGFLGMVRAPSEEAFDTFWSN